MTTLLIAFILKSGTVPTFLVIKDFGTVRICSAKAIDSLLNPLSLNSGI